jgi:hypothetical protein
VEHLQVEGYQETNLQTPEAIKQGVSVGKLEIVGLSSTDSPHELQPTNDDGCTDNHNPIRGGPHLNLPAHQGQNTIQSAR